MKRTAVMAVFIAAMCVIHGAASQPDALARLRDALGGETALSAVRTLPVRSTIDRQPHKDNVEVAVSLPDRFVRTLRYLRVPEFPRASINGLRWPHRLIKSRNGTVDEDSTIERYEVNVKLSEKTFRK